MARDGRIAEPRFLHKRPEVGYTSRPGAAMRGEPEAIDRETQERYSRDARMAQQEAERLKQRQQMERDHRQLRALRAAVDKRLEALDKRLSRDQD